jgi:hypothetical protein
LTLYLLRFQLQQRLLLHLLLYDRVPLQLQAVPMLQVLLHCWSDQTLLLLLPQQHLTVAAAGHLARGLACAPTKCGSPQLCLVLLVSPALGESARCRVQLHRAHSACDLAVQCAQMQQGLQHALLLLLGRSAAAAEAGAAAAAGGGCQMRIKLLCEEASCAPLLLLLLKFQQRVTHYPPWLAAALMLLLNAHGLSVLNGHG